MPDLTEEDIGKYLPSYLSQISKDHLQSYIRNNFPYGDNPDEIYIKNLNNNLYQGDIIFELVNPVLNIEDGKFEIEYRNGILLSNSCNAERKNNRLIDLSLNFAQVIPLKELLIFLQSKNINEERIVNFEREIKKNSFNYFFYLPEYRNDKEIIFEESIVRFDRIITLPVNYFYEQYSLKYQPDGDKIISLSQYGFYLFLFKISFYFSRMNEGFDRGYME